ncbi:MAG: 4-hydroxythreonine-4-phosphate dehydrogenase PdxA [Thermoanaerobaculia bacterium]|nr:4-hydroxythreonine-4-phosphate dehydrogenase PdxA [Thermoanaerobaculia bacterium]
MSRHDPPLLALSQGDPSGIGPELLLKLVARGGEPTARPILLASPGALEAVRNLVDPSAWNRLRFLKSSPSRARLLEVLNAQDVPVVDPGTDPGRVHPGEPTGRGAEAALAALDLGIGLARDGLVDALVTLPVSKASIAEHVHSSFRGHTDYLAAACGLEVYGRDYLMAFLSPDLDVALLTTHLPLRQALDRITTEAVVEALQCLHEHAPGRIAVPGINPHAGEGGLLGSEDREIVAPAVARGRELGLSVRGPESPDSIFGRAREGLVDWVLALYHDQGLIAVKTAARGRAVNWTLGLPFLRTSVDHGTAFDIAGRGIADPSSLLVVMERTARLVEERRCPDPGPGPGG